MSVREASHAGSWYDADETALSSLLDRCLERVPGSIEGVGQLPLDGARIIIGPHAGYAYSGPAAAWAYKSLNLSKAKRIFLLGPSHHVYLSTLALSQCSSYETPLGPLRLDADTIAELRATGRFENMSLSTDEDEHSLEMHLPYIHKMLSRMFGDDPDSLPPLVPILVGATSPAVEKTYGRLLAPYVADPSSAFIISSDFCHWGTRFSYTYYLPEDAAAPGQGYSLKSRDKPPASPRIHESIGRLDKIAMDAVETGSHDEFLKVLRETGNTVCGRHPIGVILAALEELRKGGQVGGDDGRFRFVRYERSSDAVRISDSSVSYASAFAVVRI